MIRKVLLAAALLVAIGNPALAAPLSPKLHEEMAGWSLCGVYTGFWQGTLKGAPDAADQELQERLMAAVGRLSDYYDKQGLLIDDVESQAMTDEAVVALKARVAPFIGRPDIATAVRDELRPDMQACLAKAEAMLAPPVPPPGT